MSKFTFLEFLKKETSKPYFEVLKKLTMLPNVTPKPNRVFFAFKNFDFDNLKVIIIGQDPYPNKGDADGMCFSSNATKCPASLKNIFIEIKNEYPNSTFETFSLNYWKNQGVLLLNSILTNIEGKTLAHKNLGWELFNQNLLTEINSCYSNIIYLILGNNARDFIKNIDMSKQIIVYASHPSPLAAYKGFFGSNVFKKINFKLKSLSKDEIDWSTKK